MNKLWMIAGGLFVLSCSNVTPQETASEAKTEQHDHENVAPATGLQLNNGAKWKADDATRKNVEAITRVINDPAYSGADNQLQLVEQLETSIDTLVQECRMQGADHDALHVWLEQLLHDVDELKEGEASGYDEAYAVLKKDAESFTELFE